MLDVTRLARALGATRPFVLLEDRLDAEAPARLYRDPVAIVRCEAPDGVDGAFERLESAVAGGLHAAGFFSYDLGHTLEPGLKSRPPAGPGTPLMWFGLFERVGEVAADLLDAAFAALGPPPPIDGLTAAHSRADHIAKVGEILRLIAAGDIYQANLTFPMRFTYGGDPLALYGALRTRQPVAHAGVVALDDICVLSVSPELFVEVHDGQATTRPMKGTTPRGADAQADAKAARALAADPKQRAENLMIVDLLRNDLARVAAPGTVRAPALFTVETYPTFHALTSTITARLRPDADLRQRVAALFPCGSVVGAPKIRAAQVIDALEAESRGVYTGAIGHLAPGGDMAFNVAIRTAVIGAGGVGRYGVGGGIVADSDPDAEYDEALLKACVLSDLAGDYGLIETFRWSPNVGFVRLDGHLRRLAGSAARLGFRFDRSAMEARLAREATGWPGSGDRRVRALLVRDGDLTVSHQALAAPPSGPLRVGVAEARLDAGDPFLGHKTTRRATHDGAFDEAAGRGFDEALLLDRRGRIADATRNTVFARVDGRLLTPPVGCGALPGVLRAALIAEGRAVEAPLTLADLTASEQWFVGNSLHGLREARLAAEAL